MARLVNTSSRVVRRPRLSVTVNGIARPEVSCLRVVLRSGLQPSECLLAIPQMLAGHVAAMEDALVVVTEAGSSAPIFRGYVSTETASEDASNSRVVFGAHSILSLLDRVYLGQVARVGVAKFPQRNPMTGEESGWNLENVARAIFGPLSLDAQWRSLVALGDTSALARARGEVDLPDLVFAGESVIRALRKLLGFAPDISVRERFTTERTLLDFFAYGDATAGVRSYRAADDTYRGPEDGAVVSAYVATRGSAKIFSRCVAYGDAIQYMVTLSSEPTDNALQLFPAWDVAPGPPYLLATVETAEETAVLALPDRAVPGTAAFVPDREDVFRRFTIPQKLRAAYDAIERNAFETESGARLGVQVFRQKTRPAADQSGSAAGVLQFEVADDDWELIRGARVDWQGGTITLPRPAVDLWTAGVSGGVPVATYEPMHVYLTITLQNKYGPRRGYDTGSRGTIGHPVISDTGLVLSFVNQSVRYWQVGAAGLVDWEGGTHDLGARWYDDEAKAWSSQAVGVPNVIRDDRRYLASIAERSVAARQQARTDANVSVPAYAPGVRPGDAGRVLGRGIDSIVMTAHAVELDPVRVSTKISMSDRVPMPFLDVTPDTTAGEKLANPNWTAPTMQQNAQQVVGPGLLGNGPNAFGTGATPSAPQSRPSPLLPIEEPAPRFAGPPAFLRGGG